MTASPARRKVLYVGDLRKGATSSYRYHALSHIGQEVIGFDISPYFPRSPLVGALAYRFPFGPLVARINRDLRRQVSEAKPDVVIFDKPVSFTAKTIEFAKQSGAVTVSFNQDNPFGPRNDGCWRQYMQVFRLFDLHCAIRRTDEERFSQMGLNWIRVSLSFEPTIHCPPPANWSDTDRTRDLSYVGSPLENRPTFLRALGEDHHLPLILGGPRWEKHFPPDLLRKYVKDAYLAGDSYRQALWSSKINLAFLTHANEEDVSHKAIEIAACGSFMLIERSAGHATYFEEDEEAVFFSSVEECAEKARFYLPRADLREAIGARARERAARSGYDNDTQMARILNHIDGKSH